MDKPRNESTRVENRDVSGFGHVSYGPFPTNRMSIQKIKRGQLGAQASRLHCTLRVPLFVCNFVARCRRAACAPNHHRALLHVQGHGACVEAETCQIITLEGT